MAKRGARDWYDMEETPYRASQLCRILGNPKAYQILRELEKIGAATPTDLAEKVNRTVSTVSNHLKTLREIHLVRYKREGMSAVYRLKHPAICKILDTLENLVDKIRAQKK